MEEKTPDQIINDAMAKVKQRIADRKAQAVSDSTQEKQKHGKLKPLSREHIEFLIARAESGKIAREYREDRPRFATASVQINLRAHASGLSAATPH